MIKVSVFSKMAIEYTVTNLNAISVFVILNSLARYVK